MWERIIFVIISVAKRRESWTLSEGAAAVGTAAVTQQPQPPIQLTLPQPPATITDQPSPPTPSLLDSPPTPVAALPRTPWRGAAGSGGGAAGSGGGAAAAEQQPATAVSAKSPLVKAKSKSPAAAAAAVVPPASPTKKFNCQICTRGKQNPSMIVATTVF